MAECGTAVAGQKRAVGAAVAAVTEPNSVKWPTRGREAPPALAKTPMLHTVTANVNDGHFCNGAAALWQSPAMRGRRGRECQSWSVTVIIFVEANCCHLAAPDFRAAVSHSR